MSLAVRVVIIALALFAGIGTWLAPRSITFAHGEASQQTALVSAPPYSHSWYVKNMNNVGMDPTSAPWGPNSSWSELYNQGYVDGTWDTNPCKDSLVILDFGQPAYYNGAYGANNFASRNPFYDNLAIAQAAEDYAFGWYQATTSCARLRLDVGTNNFSECPAVNGESPCDLTEWGVEWENVVWQLNDYLSTNNFLWQITPGAADDIEGDTSRGWDGSTPTEQVVNGYNSDDSSGWFLFDYGDADTCCGWTTSQFYDVAWAASHDVPRPEIYSSGEPGSWGAVETQNGDMIIWGTMSECQNTYNFAVNLQYCWSGEYAPYLSYNEMYSEQQSVGGNTDIYYTTNIKHQGTP